MVALAERHNDRRYRFRGGRRGLQGQPGPALGRTTPFPGRPTSVHSAGLTAGGRQPRVAHHPFDAELQRRLRDHGHPVGPDQGLQTIVVRQGPHLGTVSVVLTGPAVYVKANAFGLEEEMGFTPPAAAAEAGRWVEATDGAGEPKVEQDFYQAASASLTVGSSVAEVGLDARPTLVPVVVKAQGELTLPLRMSKALSRVERLTCALYVRVSGPPLPVEEVTTSSVGAKSTTVFGPWGHVPSVSTPKGAVRLDVAWLSNSSTGPVTVVNAHSPL